MLHLWHITYRCYGTNRIRRAKGSVQYSKLTNPEISLSYLGVFTFCTCCILICLLCIVASFVLCVIVVGWPCVLLYLSCVCVLLSYVYLLYYVCIAVFFLTLDAGLLARSQYSEGPPTGHLDTGFSWLPCVYKKMLRWFPRFQVATICFSCSPPDLNLVVTNFTFCIHVK